MVPALRSYNLLAWVIKVGLARFTFVHKGVLVIIQGCIGVSEQGLWIGLLDSLVRFVW